MRPRRLRHAFEPQPTLCQRSQQKLGGKYGAPGAQAFPGSRVLVRDARLVGLRTESGQNALGVEQVFQPERNAVQRSAIMPRADLLIRGRRLLQCQFFGGSDQAEQLGRVLLHTRQVHLREVGGRNCARLQ